MDILLNFPPNHGGPLGDVWFRGLAKPDHFLTALKEDFYILVVGCMMKYIRLERAATGLTYKARVVKAFNHGVDGVSAIAGSQFRDVYALAEKKHNPRIFLFQIHKTDRGELEPQYMHSLKRIRSWDIRSLEFISKELLVVLTGIPTFNVVLFRWNTNEELMASQAIEPNLFSKLLVSPVNPCRWMEYGREHMFAYEMPSLTRTEVTRTKINLPGRLVKYDHADPLMGKRSSTKISSACWTALDEFYILDAQLGIHMYLPNQQILQWTCSIHQTFLGVDVEQIVSYKDGIAAITSDGWFLSYSEIKAGGILRVHTAYKLTSRVLRYLHFPETPETFYAVTESKGMVEGVTNGMLRDPFAIPDLMFTNILSCCFIEPQSDYMAIVTKFGKVVILECETGAPIAKWRLPFKVVGVISHPVLPFLFCGTNYGCVNVLDIRNLKSPKLINRRLFTREPNASIEKFGIVSQGRYVISADTINNRVFVQYGYPFMAFDFVDSAKVPAKISHISVPGCDKDDNRFQVYMSGKSPSDEGVVAFIINFSMRGDRLTALASQIVDHPVTAMCLTPMRKYQYAYYPLTKALAVVAYCDDNQWLNLQEPEHIVETTQSNLKTDIKFMTFVGSKLYTFGEDGCIHVHEPPIIPKKKNLLPMVLRTLVRTQTHCHSDRGIKEGVVSLDGSQVIALGHDGTFCRVRFFVKPAEPDWTTLGYERPKLAEYQIGTYLIDQEFQKAGEEPLDRIAEIKIKLEMDDPVSFQKPEDEGSDDEQIFPDLRTPKVEAEGEKLKYGPRKSIDKTVKRKAKKGRTGSMESGVSGESQKQDTLAETKPETSRISEVQLEDTEVEDSISFKQTPRKTEDPEESETVPGTGVTENAGDDEESASLTAQATTEDRRPSVYADFADKTGEEEDLRRKSLVKPLMEDFGAPPETEVLMKPSSPPKEPPSHTELAPQGKQSANPDQVLLDESSAVQKLMSKLQQAEPAAPTPLPMDEEKKEPKPRGGKWKMKGVTVDGEVTAPASETEGEASPPSSDNKPDEQQGGNTEAEEQDKEQSPVVGESGEVVPGGTEPKRKKRGRFSVRRRRTESSKLELKRSIHKITKFAGGQASKMLAAANQKAAERLKAPPSRAARKRLGHTRNVKHTTDDDDKSDGEIVKKKKSVHGKKDVTVRHALSSPRARPDEGISETSKGLVMEVEAGKNMNATILHDPAIFLQPEQKVKDYEGPDVSDVLTVEHAVRRKEFTEAEFFTQYEKTLLYRQNIPKAQSLREEFTNFTALMEELMSFNKQREEGNQVDVKEFNFDEDREPRLKEKAEKIKKIAHIQMTVRNKLRHAKINAMKYLLWDQFETKGMTLTGFRNRLEVSNYPLLPEREFYEGPVKEAISWRRLEMRLEIEEKGALLSANEHALRVLQHEMQFMAPNKKRLYMKSIMAIDPTIRFDDYEASDSDQSDEFFNKVFEEMGFMGDEMDANASKAKAGMLAGVALETSRAASTFLSKVKGRIKGQTAGPATPTPPEEEGYAQKLKRLLLEEQEKEDLEQSSKAAHIESSTAPSDEIDLAQSRRDFMVNIKPTKSYHHPTGLFGPRTEDPDENQDGVEVLMKPHAGMKQDGADLKKGVSEAPSIQDTLGLFKGIAGIQSKPKSKYRMVIKQRKKMKFKRRPDVVIEDEADQTEAEEEAANLAMKKKFDMMDDAFKERFDSINNTFYGSSMSELVDMYQYQPAPFRYSQFDLGSRHELWRHQYIITSEIYQLKKFFDRQFDLLRNSKGYSLKKMADRNERIREIYYYLKVDLDILDEKWSIQEDPSQIFTVTKDEIPVERYLTAEQRRLEELRRLEDLARRKTRMAEFRKKALIAMMDNRLEVKREEILVNDVPKPPFMLEKDPVEYSIEEYLLSLQYAEAVEALEKARFEMIKELEEELGRLYRANAMEINTVNLRVTELSLMKFQFYQNYQMEETRILRAMRQLRIMEDLDKEEIRIGKIVDDLKSTMKSSQSMASQLASKKTGCEEEITKIAEQERDLERNFKRDLGDVGQYFEPLYKNYKKKPKLSLKGLNRAEVYETMVRALRSDNIRVFARENGETGRTVVMSIYDLEDPLLMPKDCPRSYWDKFNAVRRERLACEYQTRTLMAEIDRINVAINECTHKEAERTEAIASVLAVISHKNDLKNYFVSNVEYQMVLGKGQCEINCWNFKDHMNSTIILIDNVESLNQKIFEASEKLIKEMTRTATVHRDIKEIEWRFLVVEMATKDLKKVRHDVQVFKPTKKLLQVLSMGTNLDTMHMDRIALVDHLRATYIKYQKIYLRNKKKQLGLYRLHAKRRHETNEEFKTNIFQETEALVADQVNKVTLDMVGVRSKEKAEKRAAQLLCRGFLNRKLIRLSNEIEKMEEELEREYKRTYPVL